ncbi:hypothetical protein GOP47_0028091 [Adiantum capillus-veneris]|nr:hypothetical protein GOP47_0028091 [Adiantum capillus-veneris]
MLEEQYFEKARSIVEYLVHCCPLKSKIQRPCDVPNWGKLAREIQNNCFVFAELKLIPDQVCWNFDMVLSLNIRIVGEGFFKCITENLGIKGVGRILRSQ